VNSARSGWPCTPSHDGDGHPILTTDATSVGDSEKHEPPDRSSLKFRSRAVDALVRVTSVSAMSRSCPPVLVEIA